MWRVVIGAALAATASVGFFVLCGGSSRPAPAESADARMVAVTLATSSTTRHVPIVFQIRNHGTTPLRILEVQRSCACTETELSNREVHPGGTETLKATVTVSPFDRERHISCALVTNDPAERIKVFKAALSIVAPIEFRGEDSLHFGRVASGTTVTAEVPLVVRTASKSPPQFLSIRGSSPELSARTLGKLASQVSGGEVVEWQIPVLVEFTPTGRLGDSPLSLRATAMVDGRNEFADLPVHWQRVRRFEMTPRRAILEVKDGESGVVSTSVLIRRCDGMPFQIGEAQCTSAKFDLEVNRVAPDATRVSINARYSPESNERLAGLARFTTDCPDEAMINLPIVMFRSKSP